MVRKDSSQQKGKYTKVADALNKALGTGSARLAADRLHPKGYLSSGVLSLDFALGGGWKQGCCHGIYGARDIGKSTIVGMSAVREAQALGIPCAWVGVEPGFDPDWARKNGVDPGELFLVEPDNGEQAFQALYEIVRWTDPQFGLIVFDSIGALLAETEISGKTGNDGKMKQGGQAGLITWGIKRIVMPVSKNNQVVLLLNQARANMASSMGGQTQPGGYALEHHEESIVHLKRGKDRMTIKEHGQEIEIGTDIIAVVQRTKGTEGSKQKALFAFYNKSTEDNDVGIDMVSDVLATGMRTGVIRRGGAYYYLPDEEKGLFGERAVREYFEANPAVLPALRATILDAANTAKAPAVALVPEEGEVA